MLSLACRRTSAHRTNLVHISRPFCVALPNTNTTAQKNTTPKAGSTDKSTCGQVVEFVERGGVGIGVVVSRTSSSLFVADREGVVRAVALSQLVDTWRGVQMNAQELHECTEHAAQDIQKMKHWQLCMHSRWRKMAPRYKTLQITSLSLARDIFFGTEAPMVPLKSHQKGTTNSSKQKKARETAEHNQREDGKNTQLKPQTNVDENESEGDNDGEAVAQKISISPTQRYIAALLLARHPIFFKRSQTPNNGYQPRAIHSTELMSVTALAERAQNRQRALKNTPEQDTAGISDVRYSPLPLDHTEATAVLQLLSLARKQNSDQASSEKGLHVRLLQMMGMSTSPSNAEQVMNLLQFTPCTQLPKPFGSFPANASAEARNLRADPNLTRVDTFSDDVIAIDYATAETLEDAISVKILPNGGCLLTVHVIDVCSYIQPASKLFSLACDRGMSVYSPLQRFTLFPPVLYKSLGLGNKHGLALSMQVTVNPDGSISGFAMNRTVLSNLLPMSFQKAAKLLATKNSLVTPISAMEQRWKAKLKFLIDISKKSRIPTDNAGWVSRCITVNQFGQLMWESRDKESREIVGMVAWCNQVIAQAAAQHCLEQTGQHVFAPLDAVSVTSPLRRAADMIALWQLSSIMESKPAPFSAQELSSLKTRLSVSLRIAKAWEHNQIERWELLALQRFYHSICTATSHFNEMPLIGTATSNSAKSRIAEIEFGVFPHVHFKVELRDMESETRKQISRGTKLELRAVEFDFETCALSAVARIL